MTNTLPLPLSQQVLAWALRALGHADELKGRVGEGTLKTARRGAPIPQTWGDLVDAALDLGQVPRSPATREKVHAALRRWDERVSSLPPMVEVPLCERLHVPMVRLIPEIGLRLGALLTVVAARTGTSVDAWGWMASPFDPHFFGRVVTALMDQKFAGKDTNERKQAIEHAGEPVSWRTVERWWAGDPAVPNHKELAALGASLGDNAETILRIGRLVCEFRETMANALGAEAFTDWAGCVTSLGVTTAAWLSDPAAARELACWIAEDRAAHVREPLAAVVRDIELDVKQEGDLRHAVAGLTILRPHPKLIDRITSGLGAQGMALLGSADFFRMLEADWSRRALVRRIAEGGTLSCSIGENALNWVIPNDVQAAAARWASRPINFTQAPDEVARNQDADELRVLSALFGEESVAVAMLQSMAPELMVMAVVNPAVEADLPDAVVASDRRLAFARACRLAETSDQDGAIKWLGVGLKLEGTLDAAVVNRVLRTYAALAHMTLDRLVRLRAMLRELPAPNERAAALDVIIASAKLAEALVSQALEIGDAPPETHALTETLVVVLPVVFRIAALRSELDADADGYHAGVAEVLVEDLAHSPNHGRAWALRSLWHWLIEQPRDARQAATTATHLGAGAFLAAERTRLEADLGLPQGVGD